MDHRIAIIGGGNLCQTLVAGLIESGIAPNQITVSDPHREKCDALQTRFHIHTTHDNAHAFLNADVIVFAVKPQKMHIALAPILKHTTEDARSRRLLISTAAGLPTTFFEKRLGNSICMVRSMPNTVSAVREGMTALFANANITDAHQVTTEQLFKAIGKIVWLHEEAHMDIATALSGSGPAYFFYIADAMATMGEQLGLPRHIAEQLVLQTMRGAAVLGANHVGKLKALEQQVTSPGGTTEAALSMFKQHHVDEILASAVRFAYDRAQVLSNIDHEPIP